MFRIIKKIGSQYYAFLPLFVPKYIEESIKIYKQYFRNKMWCSIFYFLVTLAHGAMFAPNQILFDPPRWLDGRKVLFKED